MNLIVDIGNTLVKLAVFDGGRIVAQRCVERLHPSMLGELLEGRRAAKAVVASTRGEADDVVETVRPYADYLLEFTSQTPVPGTRIQCMPQHRETPRSMRIGHDAHDFDHCHDRHRRHPGSTNHERNRIYH